MKNLFGKTLEKFSSLFKKGKKTDEIRVDVSHFGKENTKIDLSDSEEKDHAMLSNPRTPPPTFFKP